MILTPTQVITDFRAKISSKKQTNCCLPGECLKGYCDGLRVYVCVCVCVWVRLWLLHTAVFSESRFSYDPVLPGLAGATGVDGEENGLNMTSRPPTASPYVREGLVS